MRRNKIFRWLYFLILLIPMLFVFLPMLNNETIYKTEVKQNVDVREFGSFSSNILPFLINISNQNIDNEIYYINFYDIYDYLNYYGYDFNNNEFLLGVIDGNDNISYFHGFLTSANYGNIVVYGLSNNDYFISGDFIGLYNDDDDDIFEGFYIDTSVIYDFLVLTFNPVIMGYYDYSYTFFYKDYIITEDIVNTSVWYDFSVKMNDSFSFIGGFTEFVSDNIIDLSNNDYVFFSFTYMVYIFVVSLLWLLFEFLMFIINFTHKYMERFYE